MSIFNPNLRNADLRELALKKVKITGNVIGKFGAFEIKQTYLNNTKDVLEVGYTFPIVETATVVGFEIHVGDQILKGVCKKTEEAKKEYQQNMVKGNSAYLMEQETDNIFKIHVGKIDKDEEVTVIIKYIDKFEIIDNTIQIFMPTLVTPKYKSTITDKLEYGKVDYSVDFKINIDKTINRKSINCLSHQIKITDEETNEVVEVKDYDMSKDFKLEITLRNEAASKAITAKTRDDKDMIYLSFMPEITDSYEDSEKEYLFIVDVSGSMHGEKIEKTKKAVIECLNQLDEGDKFNIIPFETHFEAMNIKSIAYNEENLKKATEYVNNLRPLGGTEILEPIKFALFDKKSDKIVLLFTDGQVGNEEEIIRFVNDNVNKSRIFPFGIDTNVNSSFIKQLAKVGNGKAELIQPNEQIDDKIIRTFARIQTPLLENITIDYGKNKLIDEIREDKVLFNYEFFNVFAKVEKLQDDITLKGSILDKEYTWEIKKEDITTTTVDLEVLFAKQEMDRLEEYKRNCHDIEKEENYKQMIIDLAVKYNINSKYTSFLTVYERENKILEVPRYQETTLSDKFVRKGMVDGMAGANMMCDMAMPTDRGDRDLPPFLKRTSGRMAKVGNPLAFEERIFNPTKEFDELADKAIDYFDTFAKQEKKSVKTYLLYALYFLKIKYEGFDYSELLRYLKDNQEELLKDEECIKLLCLCYKQLEVNRHTERETTLDLIGNDYRVLVETAININIDIERLSPDKIQ